MNTTTLKPASPFKLALAAAIKAKVKELKADGTVAMSLGNLDMCVKAPSHALKGAPLGTNHRYYYKEMFAEVAREVAGRFLLGGAK